MCLQPRHLQQALKLHLHHAIASCGILVQYGQPVYKSGMLSLRNGSSPDCMMPYTRSMGLFVVLVVGLSCFLLILALKNSMYACHVLCVAVVIDSDALTSQLLRLTTAPANACSNFYCSNYLMCVIKGHNVLCPMACSHILFALPHNPYVVQ